MSGILRQSKKFAEMKTIGIILGGIFILCMVAFIIRIVVEGSRKGHNFTMKNPPKPPQKQVTICELKSKITEIRTSLALLECDLMSKEIDELIVKMSHIKRTNETS
jgi:hypothetical protein